MTLTFTLTREQSDGLSFACADYNDGLAADAKPFTDDQYIQDRVGGMADSWYRLALERRAAQPDNQALLLATLANSDDPGVANAIAELQKAVAAASA